MSAFLNTRAGLIAALIFFGLIWGLTIPLMKIAVSTGYEQFGIIFWELVFMTLYLGFVAKFQGKFPKITKDHMIVFAAIGFFGTLIPTSLSLIAIKHIPSGIYAVTVSLVPMYALPIAIFLKLENYEWRRAIGILLGFCAIFLLVGPSTSLPDPAKAIFVLLACVIPLCYAIEDNFVSKFTLRGLTSVQALFGASVLGFILITPVAWQSGQWFSLNKTWGEAEWALLTMSVLHGLAYTGYVWLVRRAGPVFAAQVAYLVTGFGVMWSIILLSESYSAWVWCSLALMLFGLFLVQPKGADHS